MLLGLSYGEVIVTVGVLAVLIGEAICCKILNIWLRTACRRHEEAAAATSYTLSGLH